MRIPCPQFAAFSKIPKNTAKTRKNRKISSASLFWLPTSNSCFPSARAQKWCQKVPKGAKKCQKVLGAPSETVGRCCRAAPIKSVPGARAGKTGCKRGKKVQKGAEKCNPPETPEVRFEIQTLPIRFAYISHLRIVDPRSGARL